MVNCVSKINVARCLLSFVLQPYLQSDHFEKKTDHCIRLIAISIGICICCLCDVDDDDIHIVAQQFILNRIIDNVDSKNDNLLTYLIANA